MQRMEKGAAEKFPVTQEYLILHYTLCRRRQWHLTPVLLPGKPHGRRSLPGSAVHGVAKSQTRLNDFTFTFHFHALEKEMATHSSEAQGRGSLVGCRLCGHMESDTTEVT